MTVSQHKNVYSALCAAQMAMEPVLKGAINPAFKGEGKPKGTAYADLADVVSAVRPAPAVNGLAYFHQMVMFDEKAAMRTFLYHGESETSLFCDVPLIVQKNDMQGMKSATTYAKRIGLESVTGVAPEDDDGNAAVAARPVVDQRQDATPADAPRDPAKIASGLIAAIAKATTESGMELMNAEGTKFATAWQWLEDNDHKPQAAKVKAAWDARFAALANADLGGDTIPYN